MSNYIPPKDDQSDANSESQQSPWEFFISQEERSYELDEKKSSCQDENPEHNVEKSWIVRLLKEPNGADWIIAAFTVVIAVVGILQWQVIGGQLDEMKKGGTDTHELAVQAKNQADRTKELAELSDKTLRLDQRAWMSYGIETLNSAGIPAVGKPFVVRITYRNLGKSPAIKTLTCSRMDFLPKGKEPDFTCPNKSVHWVKTGTIFSGPTFGAFSDLVLTPNFQQDDWNKVMSEQSVVWAYGRVEYYDVFGIQHWFTFCNHLLTGGGYAICEGHIDTDKN